MSTMLANPAKMMERGAPHVIHNDAELDTYTEALFKLTSVERPNHAEMEAIELLSLLIDLYEQQRFPIPAADPVSVLRYLLDRSDLSQRDIVEDFGGSESLLSMIMSGQRKLTVEHIRRLSARFQVSPSVFIA